MTVAVDLDLRPLLGDVRDQGPRSTCLAHATSVAHERSRGITGPLSPQYLHYFATAGAIGAGCGFPAMQKALRIHGQPSENDCAYTMIAPDSSWKPPAGVVVFRRSSDLGFDHGVIRQSLQQNAVVILGVELTITFYKNAAPWIISPAPLVNTLHAVAAVGHGSAAGRPLVLIRNSWGTSWADGGHAWLDDDFVSQHVLEMMVMREEVS